MGRQKAHLRGKRRVGGIPFHRRHRRPIVFVLSLALLVVGIGAGYAFWVNQQLNNVAKVTTDSIKDRPDPDKGKALNILLLGSDKGKKEKGYENTTLSEDAAAAKWPNGKYRSDTLMIVHVTANRKHVYLTSIPRDTYTTLYDANGEPREREKINAAFSYYGPNGAISTVEHLTNVRINHLAIIDWDGFKDLSSAVGGVPVYIPRAFYDPKQKVQWQAGQQTLEGRKALAYVRTRYGLLRGDFDRIARQQNFLRAMMKKMLSKGVTSNPVRLTRTLSATVGHLTVDQEWDAGDMRALALSLRNITTDDVTFMTAPVATTEDVAGVGNVVVLDEAKAELLYKGLRKDTMRAYVRQNPDAVLADEKDVG